MGKLTATHIKHLQAKEKDYRIADGNSLYLSKLRRKRQKSMASDPMSFKS